MSLHSLQQKHCGCQMKESSMSLLFKKVFENLLSISKGALMQIEFK
jgi:hypothetical protein